MELESFSGGGQSLYPNNLLGHLLLVWAVDYIPHSPTKYSRPDKPSDVIVVDVVDLDAGAIGTQSWWRQGRLIRDLKPKLGKKNPVLVVLQRDIASQGGEAAYTMAPMTDNPQAVAKANAWFQANPGFTPSSPMPQAPPVQVTPEPRDTQPSQPPDWARTLPSEPGGPAWLPAQETWPGQQEQAHNPYQPPAPARPLTQAERMAQAASEQEKFGY